MDKLCDEWLKAKNVNPKTGRKIGSTGNIYKKLVKDCEEKPKCRPSSPDKVCAEWLKNKSVNPKTGRKIASTGNIYKKLARDCAEKPKQPSPLKAQQAPPKQPSPAKAQQAPQKQPSSVKKASSPKKASLPKEKKASPKLSKSAFLTFDQVREAYLARIDSYPVSKKTILLKFHPDKLPQAVKEAMAKHPSFSMFSSRVFDELLKKGSVRDEMSLRKVLDNHKAKFDSPFPEPKPSPSKDLGKLKILSMAEIENQLPDITYDRYEELIDEEDNELIDEEELMAATYGPAAKVLTESLAKKLVGRKVFALMGQRGYWDDGPRTRKIVTIKIIKVEKEDEDRDGYIFLTENDMPRWDSLGPFFRINDDGKVVTGNGADCSYFFLNYI